MTCKICEERNEPKFNFSIEVNFFSRCDILTVYLKVIHRVVRRDGWEIKNCQSKKGSQLQWRFWCVNCESPFCNELIKYSTNAIYVEKVRDRKKNVYVFFFGESSFNKFPMHGIRTNKNIVIFSDWFHEIFGGLGNGNFFYYPPLNLCRKYRLLLTFVHSDARGILGQIWFVDF